jgi:hypothetical protein
VSVEELRRHPLWSLAFAEDGTPRPGAREGKNGDPAFDILSATQGTALAEAAKERGIPVRAVRRADAEELGQMNLSFGGPTQLNVDRYNRKLSGSELTNRTSIIFRLTSDDHPDFSLLMTGDAWDLEARDEGDPANPNPNALKTDIRGNPPVKGDSVTVLKVPHHGSSGSQDEHFYRNVLADVYLVPSNPRHHLPTYEALTWIVRGNAGAKRTGYRIYVSIETPGVVQLAEDPQYGPEAMGYQLFVIRDGRNLLSLQVVNGKLVFPDATIVRSLPGGGSRLSI